jgi:hypothetical protein
MVLEHLFVGEIMRHCWTNGLPGIEMLKSQVDNSGYDIVLETNSVMRHIQLKASHVGAATPAVNVNSELSKKPSGCVIWMFFDPRTLRFSHFLWFGQSAGNPLAEISHFPTGTHNKRNAQGIKSERPNIKRLSRAAFVKVDTIEELIELLFLRETGEHATKRGSDVDDLEI